MAEAKIKIVEGENLKEGDAVGFYYRNPATGFWEPLKKEVIQEILDFARLQNDYKVGYNGSADTNWEEVTFPMMAENIIISNMSKNRMIAKINEGDEFRIDRYNDMIFSEQAVYKVDYKFESGTGEIQIIGTWRTDT